WMWPAEYGQRSLQQSHHQISPQDVGTLVYDHIFQLGVAQSGQQRRRAIALRQLDRFGGWTGKKLTSV
ncbi:MAG: hypothetical protein O7G86_15490, partial [Gammaproteobacteria bacterium]|nr:hypothetical protein [Gammaproteobacteria bacterium]